MFLSIEEFAHDLLQGEHAIAVLKWKNREKLAFFCEKLPAVIKELDEDVSVFPVSARNFDSTDFLKTLQDIITKKEDAQVLPQICLLIVDIETITPDASTILNSFREHLGSFYASIIVIRKDEYYNFVLGCPDLMDWVGTLIGSIEDLIPTSFTIEELKCSIKALEEKYTLTSAEFIKQYNANTLHNIPDTWLWKELLEILDNLGNTENL